MNLNPNKLRQHVLKMVYEKSSGHIGGSFSMAEIVAYIYSNYDVASDKIGSSRFILSKGHGVPIVYSALYELGLISDADMNLFREVDSPLQGHPDKVRMGYMHATTGSLGQGLSIAIGHALAMKQRGLDKKCFCILGDGEMQEGQVWEALMLAPKYKLDNLICIVDHNKSQNDGLVEDILSLKPLDEKIKSFNWEVHEMDGNNKNEVSSVISKVSSDLNGMPKFIIANTQKGFGVSFMNDPAWHAKAPNKSEFEMAMKELKC